MPLYICSSSQPAFRHRAVITRLSAFRFSQFPPLWNGGSAAEDKKLTGKPTGQNSLYTLHGKLWVTWHSQENPGLKCHLRLLTPAKPVEFPAASSHPMVYLEQCSEAQHTTEVDPSAATDKVPVYWKAVCGQPKCRLLTGPLDDSCWLCSLQINSAPQLSCANAIQAPFWINGGSNVWTRPGKVRSNSLASREHLAFPQPCRGKGQGMTHPLRAVQLPSLPAEWCLFVTTERKTQPCASTTSARWGCCCLALASMRLSTVHWTPHHTPWGLCNSVGCCARRVRDSCASLQQAQNCCIRA